jgi:hypothetical protein
MAFSPNGPRPTEPDLRRLLAYVADLELEVDRLRRHSHRLHQETRAAVDQIRRLCANLTAEADRPTRKQIADAAEHVGAVLRDLQEVPGYHPAHDEVIAIAVRPLVEQVFRWQQRLLEAPGVVLRLELPPVRRRPGRPGNRLPAPDAHRSCLSFGGPRAGTGPLVCSGR